MESGKIKTVWNFGTGKIDADQGPSPVSFTRLVFEGDWQDTYVGAAVRFERAADNPNRAVWVALA